MSTSTDVGNCARATLSEALTSTIHNEIDLPANMLVVCLDQMKNEVMRLSNARRAWIDITR
jgi:hypothetical protein